MDPYVTTDGKYSYLTYEPKSARLQHSPYLQPIFPPHNPYFGGNSPRTRSRSPNATARSGVLAETGRNAARLSLSTPFKNTPYRPPYVEQTYAERKEMFEQRERDHDMKNSRRFMKKYPVSPYKTSMIGQYEQCVIGRQIERVHYEEDVYRATSQASQRRCEQQYQEAVALHEEQMKKSGVKEPKYNY